MGIITLAVVLAFQAYALLKYIQAARKFKNLFNFTSEAQFKRFNLTQEQLQAVKEYYLDNDNPQSAFNYLIALDSGIDDSSKNKQQIILIDWDSSALSRSGLASLLHDINRYSLSNQGFSPDYHVVREMCESKANEFEEQLLAWIPAPLYLGIGGTMFGVLVSLGDLINTGIGLSSMSFIQHLQLPIFGSIAGLISTIILSLYTAKLKKHSEEKRSELLREIQVKMLPVMAVSDESSNKLLARNLASFNRKTPEFIKELTNTSSELKNSIDSTSKVLDKVNAIKLDELIEKNAQAFKNLCNVLPDLEQIDRYFTSFSASTNALESYSKTLELHLKQGETLREVLSTLHKEAETNKQIRDFLNNHFQQAEDLIAVIDKQIRTFKEITAALTENLRDHLNTLKVTIQVGLQSTTIDLKKLIEDSRELIAQSLIETRDVASRALADRFELLEELRKLDHLKELGSLKKLEELGNLNETLSSLAEELNSTTKMLKEVAAREFVIDLPSREWWAGLKSDIQALQPIKVRTVPKWLLIVQSVFLIVASGLVIYVILVKHIL